MCQGKTASSPNRDGLIADLRECKVAQRFWAVSTYGLWGGIWWMSADNVPKWLPVLATISIGVIGLIAVSKTWRDMNRNRDQLNQLEGEDNGAFDRFSLFMIIVMIFSMIYVLILFCMRDQGQAGIPSTIEPSAGDACPSSVSAGSIQGGRCPRPTRLRF
jgi:hypothetical protein